MAAKSANSKKSKNVSKAYIATRYVTKPIMILRNVSIEYLENYHTNSWFNTYDEAREYIVLKCEKEIRKFNKILRSVND